MLPHHKEPSSRHALKGQKLLAQGNTLGISAIRPAPCKGKSLKNFREFPAYSSRLSASGSATISGTSSGNSYLLI
ncbi:hypothetical protein F7D28_12075 [Prevotella copri]|nr:hypothetical protein [Segatella copri]MUU06161.1 hypothetical protein [Segatella copri]MUU14411.1 hypothetical protein [Segatella copri]